MLPLQSRIIRPWRECFAGDRSLVGAPAIHHADVEATGEVVHVDFEREGEGLRAAGCRGWGEGEELGTNVDGAGKEEVGDEEDGDNEGGGDGSFGDCLHFISLQEYVCIHVYEIIRRKL